MSDDDRTHPWTVVGPGERPSERSADNQGVEDVSPGDRIAYLVEPSPDP